MKLRGVARLALMVIPVAGAAAPLTISHLATAIPPAIIVVGTFDDPASSTDCSATTGSGTVNCSLRAAVLQANSDNNADIIQLGVGTYMLKLNSSPANGDSGSLGDLEVNGDMTIQGAGPTQTIIQGVGPDISTPWNDRIIEVADEASSQPTVTISELTVTGGDTIGSTSSEQDGGGILSASALLTINNVVVDKNTAAANGGGVASEFGGTTGGTLTITHSTLSTNTANNTANGGTFGNGGGLFASGSNTTLDTFSNLFITGNTAAGSSTIDAGGGGIYDDLGGLGATFTDIMVVGNHAPNMSGGGIYENSFNGSTPLSSYNNLTLSGNDALVAGGGFYAADTLTSLTNATITGNSTTGDVSASNIGGGGIAAGLAGSVTVNNATINGNTSTTQGGGLAAIDRGDHIHLHNTILVKNTMLSSSSDCFVGGIGPTAIDSTGYNIVDDLTCALVPTTDRQGSSFNPNLGVLQDNTGPLDGAPGDTSPTLTEALPTGSIAIDTADPAGANNPATDERGVSRPQGTASDVGAYEAIPPVFVAPILPAAGHPPSGNPSQIAAALLLATISALAVATLSLKERS
jgi:hypothetical protein